MDSEEKSTELTADNNLLIRCYFCDEVFPNNEFQNHITYCQSVIEKCPQNCGVYIERQQKDFHVTNYCSETIKKSTKSKPDNAVNNHKCLCCEYCCKTINEIESEVKILQLRIDDEKRNRLKFEYNWLNELSKFHQRYQETEEWRGSMFSVLSTLQKSIFREEQIRLKEVNDMKNKFDRIAAVLKNFEMSMNELDGVIKDIKNSCLSRNEEVVEHFDSWMTKQENRMVALHNLNTELEKLQVDHISRSKSMLNLLDLNEIIIENQEQCSEQVKNCGKDIEVFKEFLSQENFMISSIWYEQLEQFKLFKIQIEKADEKLEELLSWQKFVKKKLIKIENLWKLEPNESILNELQNSIMLYPSDVPVYSNGHLLWSVLDFEEQFEESQHTNITLRSPAFYTNEYGYKLQMRLYPNGLGQWKGRHMIISLHILNSDWDSLLEWPVKINATVSMKDQSTNNPQVKDVIKCFGNNVIYKENDSTKTLQMYVPHRLLKENKYINNNSIILEASVSVVKD